MSGCLDNHDPRFNKSYFNNPSSVGPSQTGYQTGSPIQITSYTKPIVKHNTKLTLASWNLRKFGPAKSNKSELLSYFATNINAYDIVITQEITDKYGDAFKKLASRVKNHSSYISSRVGTTNYSEQYGVFYRNANLSNITILNITGIERHPLMLRFVSRNWTFNIVTLHTRPDHAQEEIKALSDNISWMNQDTIVIGDLNAGCDYYKRGNDFSNWTWIINDTEDTTSGSTSCPYDRIIANDMARDNYLSYFIMRNVDSTESDHYMITATFNNSKQ